METSEDWFEKEKRKLEKEKDSLIAAIPNRIKVNKGIDLDMNKLFDVKISKAIKYLTKMKDLHGDSNIALAQCDPYANVECYIVREVDESDEDALSRIINKENEINQKIQEKIQNARIKAARIKELQNKICILKESNS